MKNITEFSVFNLNRALAVKNEMATAGKTPEEISAGIGEQFKLEGDKLKHFVASLGLIDGKAEKLKRVLVVSFGEGETVPASVQKVEDGHYLLEYFTAPHVAKKPEEGKGRGKGRGGRDGDRGGRGPGGGGRGPGGPGKGAPRGDAPAGEAKAAAPKGDKA